MSLLFKIADDGRSVYVARTLFANEMEEKAFDKKARRITVESFLSKFPKGIAEKLEKNINRVREIAEMKLHEFGNYQSVHGAARTTIGHYFVGDREFIDAYGEDEDRCPHQLEDAKAYAEYLFGEAFMKEHGEKLTKYNNFSYFADKEEITKERYNALQEEKQKLTAIIALQRGKEKETINSRKQ